MRIFRLRITNFDIYASEACVQPMTRTLDKLKASTNSIYSVIFEDKAKYSDSGDEQKQFGVILHFQYTLCVCNGTVLVW